MKSTIDIDGLTNEECALKLANCLALMQATYPKSRKIVERTNRGYHITLSKDFSLKGTLLLRYFFGDGRARLAMDISKLGTGDFSSLWVEKKGFRVRRFDIDLG